MMNLRRMMILRRINIAACGDGVLAKLVKSQSSTPSFWTARPIFASVKSFAKRTDLNRDLYGNYAS